MKSFISEIGVIILSLIIIVGLTFGGNYLGWWNYNFFAPKYAQTQEKIFTHSVEYKQGKLQELQDAENHYYTATPTQQAAMRSFLIDEFAAYHGTLTPQLQSFYNKLQQSN